MPLEASLVGRVELLAVEFGQAIPQYAQKFEPGKLSRIQSWWFLSWRSAGPGNASHSIDTPRIGICMGNTVNIVAERGEEEMKETSIGLDTECARIFYAQGIPSNGAWVRRSDSWKDLAGGKWRSRSKSRRRVSVTEKSVWAGCDVTDPHRHPARCPGRPAGGARRGSVRCIRARGSRIPPQSLRLITPNFPPSPTRLHPLLARKLGFLERPSPVPPAS